MDSQKKAYLFAFAAIFCWSTVATAFKIALSQMSVSMLIAIVSLTNIVFFSILLVINHKFSVCFRISTRQYASSALMGFLNPFLYYFILLHAYDMLSAQIALSLNYVWPISLVLFSILLLKQKIPPVSFVFMGLSFVGVVIIANAKGFQIPEKHEITGMVLALGSSVFFALFWILNLRDKRENLQKLILNFIFGFLFILIYLLFQSGISLPKTEGVLSAIYIGLAECGIAYLLWMKALDLSKSSAHISRLVFLSPFISLVFIHFVLKESIYLSTLVGLIFIIAGILLQNTIKNN